MCTGFDNKKPPSSSSQPLPEFSRSLSNQHSSLKAKVTSAMTHLTVETDDSFSTLFELAANNDLGGFKRSVDRNPLAINEVELWYGRKKFSNQMVLEQRTSLMVAATYGSLDVLKYIVSVTVSDVNRVCGEDKTTALHCAASGGSAHAVDAVKILLFAGADPNIVDANGLRPCDVIVVSPILHDVKFKLENLLGFDGAVHGRDDGIRVSTSTVSSNSPPLSSSPDGDGFPSSDSTTSPEIGKFQVPSELTAPEKKEYPVDPSLPDIKNSIYSTDEFRMYSFKVRPCSRAYSHDWTECPFVHPGENARRRDPRKFHYSCVPCPDFRKGACRRGDLCEYAHGVFECWLHPAQYRTRLCKDGTSCNRRVCFFAHTSEELRPLFVSTGSAVPSPRSTAAAMEMVMNLMPCSPSSISMMSPSPFNSPMSPSTNGMSPSTGAWPQPNVPTLHLAGGSLQSSRLRSSIHARDIHSDELSMLQDMDAAQQQQQLRGEMSCLMSNPGRLSSLSTNRSKALTPSNLDDLFCAEVASSPRYNSDQGGGGVFSPTHHKSPASFHQFHSQQSMLSPINTGHVYSPKNMDNQQQIPSTHSSFLQANFGSPGRMSPRSMEPLSPISSRMAGITQREKLQQLRSMSSRELGTGLSAIVGSPVNSSLSKWGSPSGKLDWSFNGGEEQQAMRPLRRSNSFEHLVTNGGEEPDFSWVQSLVKEPSMDVVDNSSPVAKNTSGADSNGNSNSQVADDHTVLGAWIEQMHLDQLAA